MNDRVEMFCLPTGVCLAAASPCRRVSISVRTGFLLILTALLLCCGKPEGQTTWSGPSKVAVVVPHSGPLMKEGLMLQLGAQMAIQDARGQSPDLPVEMVAYDSPCDAVGAIAVAERIVTDESVCAVVGYLCAESLDAVLPIYRKTDLALINPTVSAEYIRRDRSRHLFPLLYGDGDQAAFLAVYASKGLGLTRLAVISDKSTYGKILGGSFRAEAERLGVALVEDLSVNPNPEEVAQGVKLLKDASPEGIFLASEPRAASMFLIELHSQHVGALLLGPDQLGELEFYEMAGQTAEGLLVCQSILFETGDSKETAFASQFELLYKRRPDWIAAAGYEGMRLTLEVLKRSGPGRTAFLRTIRAISGPDTAFKGLSGPVFFRKDGTSRRPLYVAEIHQGWLRPAKPPTVEFPVNYSKQ